MKLSFYEWISLERKRPYHLQKLLIDIRGDSNAPQKADSLLEWKNYLKAQNASDSCVGALELAWEIYWGEERRERYRNY
jgi:hypothetical protein